MKKTTTKYKGFTIIEVVLVLAIAGLIMLMVFIALPALQRSQKDTQRKNDMSRFISQIQQYQSNNRNKIPEKSEWETFKTNYLIVNGETFDDPDGTAYVLTEEDSLPNGGILSAATFEANEHKLHIYRNATCDGEKVVASTGSRKIAIQYKLESGVACNNN